MGEEEYSPQRNSYCSATGDKGTQIGANPDERVIPLTMAKYRRRVEAVCVAAGVPLLHKDALRVSYCYHVAWDGLGTAARQAALGHQTNATVTKDYYEKDSAAS
jgi:integrase